jgi:3'-5' exoribonuclease
MSRQFLNTVRDGDSVDEIYMLADKQLRANRNANLYLLATLRDRSASMNGLKWNVVDEEAVSHVDAGDFVRVKGKVQLYQNALQMILTHIEKVDASTLDRADFEPQPDQNVDALLARLRELLLSIEDAPIRGLMECFLLDDDLVARLVESPAGVKAHHAYAGGLLEHIVNMLEVARRIEDLFPTVDCNLLMAGIFLHDLGKIREMTSEGGFSYTDEGQLLGHMHIGIELLNEKIAKLSEMSGESFPQETALRLKHMILSHHGTYEFGSSKLPMTPEAIALHHIDNLDAKVHEFSRMIDDDPNAGAHWTPFVPRIDRKLFKGQPPARSGLENGQ